MLSVQDLVNPIMHGIGPIAERKPSAPSDLVLPEGLEVISADNHWEVSEDIYLKGFPDHLKDKAPRIWFDQYWRFGNQGVKEAQGIGDGVTRLLSRGLIHTAWQHDVRREHLRQEGLKREVVFPNNLLGYNDPDPEVREWIFRVYNEHIAEQHDKNPDFYGVGVVSNWWDVDKIQGAFDQLLELGLKAAMVPTLVRDAENKEINFADPKMDPFWESLSRSGLPLCLHVGEPSNFDGRGALATGVLNAFAPFRKPMSQLVFGGVFDRHPDVRCIFVEGGVAWLLPWLQDAEALYDTYGTLLDPIQHRPSYYWRNNCYATFQADDLALRNIDVIGADRIMWAADYPHSEGTFGFTSKAIAAVCDAVGSEEAKMILGGTATKVFDL